MTTFTLEVSLSQTDRDLVSALTQALMNVPPAPNNEADEIAKLVEQMKQMSNNKPTEKARATRGRKPKAPQEPEAQQEPEAPQEPEAQQEPEAPQEVPTLEDVRKAFKACASDKGRDEALNILKGLGVSSIRELSEDQYTAAIEKCRS